MVKKFTTNCDFNGKSYPVTFYIGEPQPGSHPISFQAKWLGSEKGGNVPSNIMDSFAKIEEIATRNRVPFEDLCAYVIDEIKSSSTLAEDAKAASKISGFDPRQEQAKASQAKQQDQLDENLAPQESSMDRKLSAQTAKTPRQPQQPLQPKNMLPQQSSDKKAALPEAKALPQKDEEN